MLSRFDLAMQVRNRDRARAASAAALELGARGPFMEAYAAFLDMGDGRGPAARKAMEDLVLKNPAEFSLRYFQGVMLMEHNDFAGAIEPLRKAADLSHRRPDILFAHACALAGAGRNEEALLELKSMARRSPETAFEILSRNAPALNSLRQSQPYIDWFATLANPDEKKP
ncbi:MAG: hypothetical protein U1G05_18610 [Kiritimatiellia bacterium]